MNLICFHEFKLHSTLANRMQHARCEHHCGRHSINGKNTDNPNEMQRIAHIYILFYVTTYSITIVIFGGLFQVLKLKLMVDRVLFFSSTLQSNLFVLMVKIRNKEIRNIHIFGLNSTKNEPLEFASTEVDYGAIYVCVVYLFCFKSSSSGFFTGEYFTATVPNIP